MSLNKTKSWKVLLVSLAAAVSFSMLAACSDNNASNAEDTSTAVATYTGGTITEKEFDTDQRVMKFLSPDQSLYLEIDANKEKILEQEIAFEYLAGKASDESKKEAEQKVEIQLNKMKSGLGDTYESTLKEQGITEEDLQSYMVRILTVYQDKFLQVTDDQVTAEFEATKGDFTAVSLHRLLIGLQDSAGKERSQADALKLASEAKAALDGGSDFAETVKKYSDDTATKDSGGEYKDRTIGYFVEEPFKKAAQTLELGKVSDPVLTSGGYHLIKVDSRTEKTFDQLTEEQKDEIKGSLASKGLETFMEKELPGIIEKIDLPKSSPAASSAPSAEASAAPSASPGAEATAAPGAAAATEAPAATTAP
ncbi:peptidylprolyl isomerase [Paenibacillus donghaensis]|uniref:Peptidylprolyl isomerase n=1 Tax=Paenibacillus donghaensis TaxID=414771 RepID=A0A2Z2KFU6_9BACL|nr:peptidylprolyl isomerase [Paenibacillus donghaensis]ASA25034.1 peptidylprolyl isomerase [Paenibacillus donghaensis]